MHRKQIVILYFMIIILVVGDVILLATYSHLGHGDVHNNLQKKHSRIQVFASGLPLRASTGL
jgi:hypothetical protein